MRMALHIAAPRIKHHRQYIPKSSKIMPKHGHVTRTTPIDKNIKTHTNVHKRILFDMAGAFFGDIGNGWEWHGDAWGIMGQRLQAKPHAMKLCSPMPQSSQLDGVPARQSVVAPYEGQGRPCQTTGTSEAPSSASHQAKAWPSVAASSPVFPA